MAADTLSFRSQRRAATMSLLRATRSLDGVDRATIRVSFRLDRGEVVRLLTQYAVRYLADPGHRELSVAQTTAIVRELLEGNGMAITYETDDTDDGERDWAQRHVAKVWRPTR